MQGGTSDETLHVLPEEDWDDELRGFSDWARGKGVKHVTMVTGLLQVETENGPVGVRGIINRESGEMVLRVSALLRRAQMASERRQVIGGTVMECDSLSVTVGGESMVLPQKEFMLLYKMASFPGRIFTRQQLMDDIWGYDSSTDTHTVDVHIARLRERFRDNPDFKIVTMRGVGYKVVRT